MSERLSATTHHYMRINVDHLSCAYKEPLQKLLKFVGVSLTAWPVHKKPANNQQPVYR